MARQMSYQTNFEQRAGIDGKIIFLVLARADINYQIEALIEEKKHQELIDFIVSKITEMIDKSEPGKNFNWNPLKQSELRPIDIIELIDDKEKTLAQLS